MKSELKYLIFNKAEVNISIVTESPLDKNGSKTIWPTWKLLNTPLDNPLKKLTSRNIRKYYNTNDGYNIKRHSQVKLKFIL